MKKTIVQTLIVAIYLSSLLAGCGVSYPQMSSLEGKGDRYLCANDVIFRDDDLNPMDTINLERGSKVYVLSETKKGEGNLAGHNFVKIQLSSGKKAWVSTAYLKISECSSKQVKDSVLHFHDEAPGILAMLDAIAFAEFRNHGEATSASAYKTLYSYHKFTNFQRHPELLICDGICSDAAGRYQFMSTTWIDSNRYLATHNIPEIPWLKGPLHDFSPKNQDKMAIFKIWWRFGYTDLKNIKAGDHDTLLEVTRRLSQEWASLPGSSYGQGEIDWEIFKKYFWSRYANYR